MLSDNCNIISIEKDGIAKAWSAENGVTSWSISVQAGIASLAHNCKIGASGSTSGTR